MHLDDVGGDGCRQWREVRCLVPTGRDHHVVGVQRASIGLDDEAIAASRPHRRGARSKTKWWLHMRDVRFEIGDDFVTVGVPVWINSRVRQAGKVKRAAGKRVEREGD